MPKLLKARTPEDAEVELKIHKLARSRHAPADWITRARIVSLSWRGLRTTTIAEELGCHPQTVRRCLHRFNTEGIEGLADRAENAYQIARSLGCNPQTVRNAIHAFNERGLPEALRQGSNRPHTVHRAFDPEQAEALREMLHRSPREFGRNTSLWTLEMAARVSFEQGLVGKRISGETIRATLARLLGVRWQRAKRWITSPDPLYERKKQARPTDESSRGRLRVGRGFRGRVLVEPAGFAYLE